MDLRCLYWKQGGKKETEKGPKVLVNCVFEINFTYRTQTLKLS